MSNLIEIQTQIEKLQKQAAEIKTREFDKTVQDILAKMRAFGIGLKDLQSGKTRVSKTKGAKGAAAKRGPKKAIVVAAKYRGPSGEVWSGRGLTPRWLTTLVEQGRSKQEFLVQS